MTRTTNGEKTKRNRPGGPERGSSMPQRDTKTPGRYEENESDDWQRIDVLAARLVRRYLRAVRRAEK